MKGMRTNLKFGYQNLINNFFTIKTLIYQIRVSSMNFLKPYEYIVKVLIMKYLKYIYGTI